MLAPVFFHVELLIACVLWFQDLDDPIHNAPDFARVGMVVPLVARMRTTEILQSHRDAPEDGWTFAVRFQEPSPPFDIQ